MTTKTITCKANDPSICRFHGSKILAPKTSSVALKEVKILRSKIAHPAAIQQPAKYLEIREELAEAEAEYAVTKQGYGRLTSAYEKMQERFLETPNEENSAKLAQATGDYFNATTNRQGMLEAYSVSLVNKGFPDLTDRKIAGLAMLNGFAGQESEGELDSELKHEGLTREQFFSKLEDKKFSAKLKAIESTYTSKVHETKNPDELTKHSVLRSNLLKADDAAYESSLYAASEANIASLQS